MKLRLTILFFTALKLFALPKDSIVVHQRGEAFFSNSYIFYSDATFKHFFLTDDGQIWYGVGVYKDGVFKRRLTFKTADSSFKSTFRIHYEVNFERKLRIKGRKFKSRDYYGTSRKRFIWLEERRKLCELM